MRVLVFSLATLLKLFLVVGYFSSVFENREFLMVINPLSSALWALCFHFYKKDTLKSWFLFFLDCLLPIVGFLAVCLFIVLSPFYYLLYRSEDLDVYEIPMGEEAFKLYSDNKRISLEGKDHSAEESAHDTLEIVPYREILSGSDIDLKISAIEKLSRREDFSSIKVLKEALKEGDYEVRYFANNALSKIERKLLERIETVTEQIDKGSTDKSQYNLRGSLYLDTYLLGILDQQMGQMFLQNALYDFIFSLQVDSEQSYLYTKIIHLNILLKDFQAVLELSDKALKSSLNEDDKGKVLFYLAEAQYGLGMYDDVIKTCQKVQSYNLNYYKIKNCTEWWGALES